MDSIIPAPNQGSHEPDISNERKAQTESPDDSPQSDVEQAELQDQSQRLPFLRLLLAYLFLCFCYLISYLDMNSVATSLPTISSALDAGPTVTWVGTSYLLGQLSFQPLYGRISDITGRKPVLLFSMGCIVVGGVLCGFARMPVWLYVCRTISGIGGGGISSSVAIIVSDLVSLRSRGKYQGFISLAIGIGAAAGPFVAAGLIQTGTDGWRWAFWVPAIMGGVCFVLLMLFLPLKPVSGSFKEKVRKIDWWGVMASIAGIVLTVVSTPHPRHINTLTMMILDVHQLRRKHVGMAECQDHLPPHNWHHHVASIHHHRSVLRQDPYYSSPTLQSEISGSTHPYRVFS